MILLQILVFVLIFQALIRPLIAAYAFTRPPRMRVTFNAPAEWGVRYEDVQLVSSDGVSLSGWYVPPRNGAAVILIHGSGGNRLAVSYHGERLVREGYGILMIDLRAHGNSGGRRFPRNEQLVDDVLAAVAFLTRQPDVRGLIGVMGISTGGMMAIQAAARTVAIRAVAADGPMLGSVDDLPPPGGSIDRYWRFPLERYYQAAIRHFSPGSRPLPSIIEALRRLQGRPVLLISTGSGAERRIGQYLFENAGDPKVLWELPGAYHATGWVIEPEAYAQSMLDFFNHALGVNNPREMTHSAESADTHDEPPAAVDQSNKLVEAREGTVSDSPEFTVVGERTIGPATAMIISLTVVLSGMILLLIPYQWRWGLLVTRLPANLPVGTLFLGLAAILILGFLSRYLLRRFACRVAAGKTNPFPQFSSTGRGSCHEPITAGQYRTILWLPVILLAAVPAIAGFLIGNWLLMIWSLWMLAMCSGDIAALWAMRGLPANTIVRPHDRRPGCEILDNT